MIGVMRLPIAALLAAAPLAAAADEFHFETFRYGRRAMGMGGAVTAYADEPEALIYNPAGLAMLAGVRFSGSLHFVGLDRRRMQRGLFVEHGEGADLLSEDFVPVPSSSVISKAFGERGRHVLALSTFLASESEESFSGSTTEPVSRPEGFDTHQQSAELDRLDRIVLRGLTWAVRAREDLALGVSVHWAEHTRDLSARRVSILRDSEGMRTAFADATTGEETSAHSLLARAGVLWRASPAWSLGLACSTSSLGVYGEGEVRTILVTSGDPARADAEPVYDSQRDGGLDVASVLPWSCRAGAALRGDDWVLTADLSGHFPLNYERFSATTRRRGGPAEIVSSVEADPVVDAALGVEWRPGPAWPLRAGLFTNRTSAPSIPASPERLAAAHVDYYGATLSAGHLGESTTLAVGAEVQLGVGHDVVPRSFQSLLGEPSFVRVDRRDWRVVLFVSGAVGFAQESADRLLE